MFLSLPRSIFRAYPSRLHDIEFMRRLRTSGDILFHKENSDPFCIDLSQLLVDVFDDQGR
jgi:hypothetical protein